MSSTENISIEEQDRMINNIIDDITNRNLDTLLEKIINGEEVRTCPDGYELVGVIGVKIVDAIEVEPTLGR